MAKLSAVSSRAPKPKQYNQGIPLEQSAALLHPDSEHNQKAWVRAIKYLRQREPSIWTLDKIVSISATQQRY